MVVANDWHSALVPMLIHAEKSVQPGKLPFDRMSQLSCHAVYDLTQNNFSSTCIILKHAAMIAIAFVVSGKWNNTKTVFLCHNAVFQGRFPREEGAARGILHAAVKQNMMCLLLLCHLLRACTVDCKPWVLMLSFCKLLQDILIKNRHEFAATSSKKLLVTS